MRTGPGCELSSAETVRFTEKAVFFTDPAFLDLFAIDLRSGDPGTALSAPNSMVISASTAQKYFAGVDPIGKALRLNDSGRHERALTVTGVFEIVPPNRHIHPDALISYRTLHARGGAEAYENDWGSYECYTYVRLAPGTDPAVIEARMHNLVDRYKPGYTQVDEAGERVRRNEFTLRPLQEIHLYSDLQNEIEVNGSGTAVSFLLLVAGFVLLIAWINYVNLATARSITRAREVGVRKALGSTRGQLIRHSSSHPSNRYAL